MSFSSLSDRFSIISEREPVARNPRAGNNVARVTARRALQQAQDRQRRRGAQVGAMRQPQGIMTSAPNTPRQQQMTQPVGGGVRAQVRLQQQRLRQPLQPRAQRVQLRAEGVRTQRVARPQYAAVGVKRARVRITRGGSAAVGQRGAGAGMLRGASTSGVRLQSRVRPSIATARRYGRMHVFLWGNYGWCARARRISKHGGLTK